MMKECAVLNGKVINIGPWDYMVQDVEVGLDEAGNSIYEDRITNPLPEGTIIEEREFEYSEDYGWREVGTTRPKTQVEIMQEQIDGLTLTLGDLILAGGM